MYKVTFSNVLLINCTKDIFIHLKKKNAYLHFSTVIHLTTVAVSRVEVSLDTTDIVDYSRWEGSQRQLADAGKKKKFTRGGLFILLRQFPSALYCLFPRVHPTSRAPLTFNTNFQTLEYIRKRPFSFFRRARCDEIRIVAPWERKSIGWNE